MTTPSRDSQEPQGTAERREYLEFYRVDQAGRTKRILIPAILLLTVGPPLILFSATPMNAMPGHAAFGFIGAALMIAGLVIGFAGIAVLMLDERYLAVVAGGLVVHLGKEETFYPWETLIKIHCEQDILVLSVREVTAYRDATGRAVRVPFSKENLEAISQRLDEWRRKASWNLAPPPGP